MTSREERGSIWKLKGEFAECKAGYGVYRTALQGRNTPDRCRRNAWLAPGVFFNVLQGSNGNRFSGLYHGGSSATRFGRADQQKYDDRQRGKGGRLSEQKKFYYEVQACVQPHAFAVKEREKKVINSLLTGGD